MSRYEFLTTWCVDAPIERVFEVLRDSQAFPEWWEGVTSVEVLEPGGPDGVGERARYSWRSVLPYTGVGVWRLFAGPEARQRSTPGGSAPRSCG